ncbi:MAG: glycosyltransferase [Tannerella sp.]|nr:glycosyltransferase [Tannerella sp.]
MSDMNVEFSVIVPVYNRPDEVRELLESLSNQTDSGFETVIVDDGSSVPCREVCRRFEDRLRLKYFFKPNSGRSDTRNFGMTHASGNYFIVFDSDCILPPHYIATVRRNLLNDYTDCYGGPDCADASFSGLQKAVNYAMTSFFTTGGIRGGTRRTEKFSPRSFNMGLSKEVFLKTGGYKNMIGEDIDLSIRIKSAGYRTTLFKDAYVFHKRRMSFGKFFRQVNTFGKGRILLHYIHKGSLKTVHLLPAFFVVGHILLFALSLVFLNLWFLFPLGCYVLLLFTDSLLKNGNLRVAAASVIAAYIQLTGYGLGLMEEFIFRKASKKTQEELYKG